MGKKNTLCDWDRKEIEKEMDVILRLVNNPKYICKKCARVANTASVLCKSHKIKKKAES
jgi:hypothetical protein